MREEVVAHVILDVARRADQDPPLQKLEHAAAQTDREQQRAVTDELDLRRALRERINGTAEHHRSGERNRPRDDDAREAGDELGAIADDVLQEAANRRHTSSIVRPRRHGFTTYLHVAAAARIP